MKESSNVLALAVSIVIGACVLACSAASDWAAEPVVPPLTTADPTDGQKQDCTALSNLVEREKCYALSDDYKDCPANDMRCAPYRAMYTLDRQLKTLNDEIAALAQKKYASYTQNDPSYLEDLAAYLAESDRAWKASRDADCALEPFMQGMSRPETSDLTEACRVDRTKARISEMGKVKTALQK